MGLELSEVVYSAFAVGGGDNVGWVETEIGGDFAPGSLYGGDGVCKGTVLY